ncbi:MAG: MAP7 domain-containing protein [Patescibacteria group bacterium]
MLESASQEVRIAHPAERAEEEKNRYDVLARKMVDDVFYDTGRIARDRNQGTYERGKRYAIDMMEVRARVRTALRDPAFQTIEKQAQQLSRIEQLARAMAAHEEATELFLGAWQTALREAFMDRDPQNPPTRQEVARVFESLPSPVRTRLLNAEQDAIQGYEAYLQRFPGDVFSVTDRISIDHYDLAAIINDLRALQDERVLDDQERARLQQEHAHALAEIITKMRADIRIQKREGLDVTEGRVWELAEIYLLRRLSQRAGTGHLFSVFHAPPRDDLQQARGSVDTYVTASGEAYAFQVKTFKALVSSETLARQREIIAAETARLRGTGTSLVVLTTEEVEGAFESALRQLKTDPISLRDKYTTLKPFVSDMDGEERERLFGLIGFTEENFQEEEKEWEKGQKTMDEIGEVLLKRHREEQEWLRLAEEKGRLEQENAERLAEERRMAREQKKLREEEERVAALEAKKRAEEALVASAARYVEQQAQREVEKRIAREEAERARLEAEQKAAAEARRRAEREAEREKGWPPETLAGMANIKTLTNLGLDPLQDLARAKQRFFVAFSDSRPKKAVADEKSYKPNKRFREAFPSKEGHTSPTEADIARQRALFEKSGA